MCVHPFVGDGVGDALRDDVEHGGADATRDGEDTREEGHVLDVRVGQRKDNEQEEKGLEDVRMEGGEEEGPGCLAVCGESRQGRKCTAHKGGLVLCPIYG